MNLATVWPQVKSLYDACPSGSLPAQDAFYKRLAADKFDPAYWASVRKTAPFVQTDLSRYLSLHLLFCTVLRRATQRMPGRLQCSAAWS